MINSETWKSEETAGQIRKEAVIIMHKQNMKTLEESFCHSKVNFNLVPVIKDGVLDATAKAKSDMTFAETKTGNENR